MIFKNLTKKVTLGLFVLFSASSYAASDGQSSTDNWYDMSDPRVIFSGVSVSGGSEGVNLGAHYGSYLTGEFKQKVTLQAMHDLEYFTADYILLNANTNTGFAVESTWDRDLWGIESFNDISLGVFAKILLKDERFNFYPKLNLGMIWGDEINSTTYIKFDATTRFNLNSMFWVGVSPSILYAMQGMELRKFQATLDAGIQLSPEFSFAAHINDDEGFWFDIIFTF